MLVQKRFKREGSIARQAPSKICIPAPVYPNDLCPESSACADAAVVAGQNRKTWCPQGVGQIGLYFEF